MTLKGQMLTLIFLGHLIHFVMCVNKANTMVSKSLLVFSNMEVIEKLLCSKMQLLTQGTKHRVLQSFFSILEIY